MIAQVALVIALIVCGLLAILERRLLYAALWLAVTSALLAIALFWLGAYPIAVIELSVGAGLVTVLLVLAISAIEPEPDRLFPTVPRAPAAAVIIAVALLLITLVGSPAAPIEPPSAVQPFEVTLWEQRGADMLLQAALIFVGLLTVLALLLETATLPRRTEPPIEPETDITPDVETEPPETMFEKDLQP